VPDPTQTITRTEADWTMDGRAMLGHEILDLATTPADTKMGVNGFVFTGWFAWQLGIDSYWQGKILRPLMARMAAFGVLVKAGQTELGGRCGGYSGSPCYWRLDIDRHEAHERWADIVQRRGWWSGR